MADEPELAAQTSSDPALVGTTLEAQPPETASAPAQLSLIPPSAASLAPIQPAAGPGPDAREVATLAPADVLPLGDALGETLADGAGGLDLPLEELAAARTAARAPEGAAPVAPEGRRAAEAPVEARPTAAPASPEALERAQDILRQVRVHVLPGLGEATIELVPAELGRISIRLSVEGGELEASVRAERPETLEALGRHVPELRAALAEQGIRAERLDLSLGFHERRNRETAPPARRRRADASRAAATAASRAETSTRLARTIAAGGVDTYA